MLLLCGIQEDGSAQQEHSLSKAMDKHDQTWSLMDGCTTISCQALCVECGQFSQSHSSCALYTPKESFR